MKADFKDDLVGGPAVVGRLMRTDPKFGLASHAIVGLFPTLVIPSVAMMCHISLEILIKKYFDFDSPIWHSCNIHDGSDPVTGAQRWECQ